MTGALLDEEAHAAAGVRRVGMNALSLLGAYVLPRVFTVGAVVVAARVLGAERFGAYGAAAAFAVILSVLATLGMHPLLVRDLARDPAAAPRLLRAAHLVKTVANVVMFAMVYRLARPGAGLEGEARAAALLLGGGPGMGDDLEVKVLPEPGRRDRREAQGVRREAYAERSVKRTRESTNRNRIRGAADRGERTTDREAPATKGKRRRSGDCAGKVIVLTRGGLA